MKRLVKSLLLGVVLILLYIISSSVLHSPSLKGATFLNPPATDSQANLIIRGLHLTETKGDELLWEIEADSAHIYQSQATHSTGPHSVGTSQLKNIKLTLYQEQEPVLRLEGKGARLDMETQDVTIYGKVVATLWLANFPDGLTLETNSLKWENQKRMLSTPDSVKITKPHIQIQGQGLETDIELERVKIKQQVTTIIN